MRTLLLHDSGLPGHRDLYLQAKGKSAIVARALAEPLVREPGTHIEYSDIGFILLGEIIERLTGKSLEDFARQYIFAPMGMELVPIQSFALDARQDCCYRTRHGISQTPDPRRSAR